MKLKLALVLATGCLFCWHGVMADEVQPSKDPIDVRQQEAKPEAKKVRKKPAKQAKKGKSSTDAFIRVTRDDDKQPLTMETAIVSYVPKGKKNKGVIVDLVGAVHVGDAKYYEELNKVFGTYDVVLYELVAPEGTKIPRGGGGGRGSFVGAIQGSMKTVLELEHQLEKIDYTKENFVHADMTPDEFTKSMRDRGETVIQMMFKAMTQGASLQAQGKQPFTEAELLAALFAKDRPLQLKRLMATQLADMDSSLDIFDGPDGSTIITERNKKCLEVLKKELAGGRKRIAIFYGAAHFPDMEERLLKEFKLKRQKHQWVVAWDLASKKVAAAKPAAVDKPATPKVKPQNDPTGEKYADDDPFDPHGGLPGAVDESPAEPEKPAPAEEPAEIYDADDPFDPRGGLRTQLETALP